MADVLLTVGTRKGLFIGRRREGDWKIEGPRICRTCSAYGRWPSAEYGRRPWADGS